MIMTKINLVLISILLSVFSSIAQTSKAPELVVQENLNFYNSRNLEGFISSFSDSIVLFSFGKDLPLAEGKEEIRTLYGKLFDESPNLYSTILHRATIGNKVIDHESIVGRRGKTDPIEMVMIYEIKYDQIIKMTILRE